MTWDVRTRHTPPFHISKLKERNGPVHNAVTFATSLLLLLGMFDAGTRKVTGDSFVPLLLAGFSGLLFSIGELCPYDVEEMKRPKPGIGIV